MIFFDCLYILLYLYYVLSFDSILTIGHLMSIFIITTYK